MKGKKRKFLALAIIAIMVASVLVSCHRISYEVPQKAGEAAISALPSLPNNPLSLGSLPAAGYIDLEPGNPAELDRLGLGGPAPVRNPPYSPFNKYGMYWSEPFSLAQGDSLQVKVYGDTPVSWFGVDWASFSIRGILATTEVDEDGRSFDPQYPADSSIVTGPGSYMLTVRYKFESDTECVLVIKNTSPDKQWRVMVNVTSKSNFSFQRFLKRFPVIKNFVKSDYEDIE
jgi:hypothetical protein